MPVQYTLPPDTRAVGSGNPPQDMNAVVDALTAMGAGHNVLNAAFAGGADPSGAADSTAAIQAALNAVPARGGVVYLPAGAYKVTSTLTTTTMPTYIVGDGRWNTQVNFTGTGDCLRMYTTANASQQQWGGGVAGLTINGAGAGNGSTGLHIGDNEQYMLDLVVQGFSGTGSIGVHLDNQYWWTEKCHGTIVAINNTQGVVFDESGGALTSVGSFGYLDLTVYCYSYGSTPGPAAQDGVVVQGGARPYNGRLVVKGNFQGSNSVSTSSAALRVTGQAAAGHPNAGQFSAIANCHLDVQVECTAGTNRPFSVNFGGSSGQNTILGCYGIMDFTQGGGTFTRCNLATVNHAGTFGFAGMVLGDTNLQPAGTFQHSGVTGVPMVWGQSFGDASGFFVNDGDFFTFTLAANTTISLNPGGAACIPAPQRKVIILTQAAAGGPFTVTWPHAGSPTLSSPTVLWAGGAAPVMTAGANAVDVYELTTYNGATWYGQAIQNVS